MADPKTPDPEFIPVIEEVLSNGMAAVMLVCGAVAGAFVLWAFLEYQKSEAAKRVVIGVAANDDIPIEIEEVVPQLRGQNSFDAFDQGS